jgi:hypothetical protein
MKHNIIKNAVLALVVATSLTACEKDKAALAPTETYKLVGRIDAARTTIATATLTDATFTISYNNANSFGDAQSIFNGSVKLAGYTGITGRDTCAFFATQASGPAISYITAASASIGINSAANNNFFNYFNGPAAIFNATGYPFTNDITAPLKEGRGYFRIGQFPKYVFVVLDNVTKL